MHFAGMQMVQHRNTGINKKILAGVLWMSLIFLILAVFICLLTWGLLELSVLFK
jgi:hypothetical protein